MILNSKNKTFLCTLAIQKAIFNRYTPPPQKKSKVNSIQKHRELISIINTLPSLLPNVTLLEKMVLYLKLKILQVCLFFLPQRWGSRLNLPSCMRTVDVWSHPIRDRPKSLKQVVTAPLLNARQQVWVSRVLGDGHYKRIPRVTEGVAR